MRQIIRKIANKGRKTELFWRYGFNFVPTLQYRVGSAKRSDEITKNIISDLNRDGIAVSTVEDLLGSTPIFSELEDAVSKLLEERSDELEKIKLNANDANAIGEKTFNVELLGSPNTFDSENIFARFALQEKILDVANAYLGMIAKLRYYNVWKTFTTKTEARESQLWHYDREDNYIIKFFLYLKNIDEGAGPFTYARRTHPKGALRSKQPEYFLEENVRRSTDEQMSAVVPKENWLRATGKKGTIIFADTRGYHKGGEARTDDRLMYTCMFTSSASESKRLIKYPDKPDLTKLSKKQLKALENFSR
jgi:hypothetical protein